MGDKIKGTKARRYVVAGLSIVALLLAVGVMATAWANPDGNPGAIWTTKADCGTDQQDVNHYQTGEDVYINGSNFDPGTYSWHIEGSPGGASCDPGQTVASDNFTVDEGGSFCFLAHTVALDDCGEYRVYFGNKQDNYRVEQLAIPGIEVYKTPDRHHAPVGDSVEYTYEVTNHGNVPLSGVQVSDDVCSSPSLQSKVGGDQDNLLEPGETWIYTCSYEVQQGDPDPLVNCATASGTYGGDTISDEHCAQVDIPDIMIAKTPDKEHAQPGDVITYTYEVTIPGAVPLTDVDVADNTCDSPTLDSKINGDQDDWLEAGETWIYVCTYTVPDVGYADPVENCATAQGYDSEQHMVNAQDCASVDIQTGEPPVVRITKAADREQAQPGETIHYTYQITSTGSVSTVTVDDDVCGTPTYQSGDDGDGILEQGETWIYTCSYTVGTGEEDAVVNCATASGTYQAGSVSDEHCAAVDILVETPGTDITLDKTPCSTHAWVGQTVCYTYEVYNGGTVYLENIQLTDDKCSSPQYQSGDDNSDGLLNPGETWVYTCYYVVQQGDPDPLINCATVEGSPPSAAVVRDDHCAAIDLTPPIVREAEFVPEPTSALLMAGGLAGIAGYARLRWRGRSSS